MEAYFYTPHKRFPTCHVKGVIDAVIAEKGLLWTETNLTTDGESTPLV